MSTAAAPAPTASAADVAAVQRCEQAYNRIRDELAKVIVGQDEVIEQVLMAIFARGHALLEGVPGLAKTLLVSSLAEVAAPDVQAHPVHARPDAQRRDRHGNDPGRPADRRPAVQVPLRPAVRQHDPGRRNQPHAAQDPGRHARGHAGAARSGRRAGAQAARPRSSCWPRRTRWSRKAPIRCPRPSSTASCSTSRSTIPARPRNGKSPAASPPADGQDLAGADRRGHHRASKAGGRVPVSDQVLGYAWALVRASRPGTPEAPDFVNKWVSWGAGPRGVLTLVTCAKARAILYGRYHATVADVQAVAKPALRHRIASNYAAQAAQRRQRAS